MNKRFFLRASAALLAAGRWPAAGAQPTVIRYGGDADFAPFESLGPQGRPVGFQIDLLAALGPAIGAVFDIRLQPWNVTEDDFRHGRLDVVAMVDTAHRRQWARFTTGHATPALALYHPQGAAEAQGLQGLAGKRIAVLDSEASRDTLQRWLAGVKGPFVQVASAADALAAVQQGQADVALLPRAYADPLLAAGRAPRVRASVLSLPLQTYALAVAPGRADLQARLQRGLDTLEADGRLEALRERWLSSHRDLAERKLLSQGLAQQRGWTWALAGGATLGLGLMGAGLWRRGLRVAAERARRQRAESALQQAQALLESSFAHHPDGMLIVERDTGTVRDANAALLAVLGVAPDGLIGQPLQLLSQHVDAQVLQQLVQSLDDAGALDAAPLRLQRADGASRDCLVHAEPMRVGDVAHVFCIVRDITEQLAQDAAARQGYDALAAQLAQARQAAVDAQARQLRAEGNLQAFTRGVAHDLKTPLNAVQGFAGLLQQRLLDGHVDEAIRYTEHIGRAAQRMTAMINALASLAQVTRQPLRRQAVNMQQMVQDTWALLAAAHPERRTEFRMGALPPAQGEPDLVAQVWQNLLDNAFKYSAKVAQAKILVDCRQDERGTWYRVTDNGAGFDMARAQALFQPFQRMHSSQQFEGSGVGLSLVRRIVDHHDGDIRLRSAPGVGTVAEFTLDPVPAPAPSPSPAQAPPQAPPGPAPTPD